MFPRLIKDDAGAEVLENTVTHMKMFAEQGLRTLVFAYRWLSEAEYAAWAAKYQQASVSLEDRENKVRALRARVCAHRCSANTACARASPLQIEAVNDEIERGLTLVGASAIEDKLQEGVPEAIEKLEEANIKVWMLTGDKQETAINIGTRACSRPAAAVV